jgi:hypothetical protein
MDASFLFGREPGCPLRKAARTGPIVVSCSGLVPATGNVANAGRYSTVTAFARLRGLSTSVPRFSAEW